MIKIEALTILLKTFRINDFRIDIEEGEFHFLLGPTGSGKTLILESIIGLHKPQKGKIWIGDKEIQHLPPEQREISYVPQDLALFPHLTVKENILYGIKAKNHSLKSFEEYVESLIHVMKVGNLLDRYPAHLSGGEKNVWPFSEHWLRNRNSYSLTSRFLAWTPPLNLKFSNS